MPQAPAPQAGAWKRIARLEPCRPSSAAPCLGTALQRTGPRGREKLCNLLRIAYDARTNSVWFGGNHGFAWGNASFPGYSCAPGTWDYACAGVMEHVHPAINAWNSSQTGVILNNYFSAQVQSEGSSYAWNRLDIWPDAVAEPEMPTREQRVDDHVSGIAVLSDQSFWVGSWVRGLAQLSSSGQVLRTLSTELIDGHGYVSAVAADPLDDSVWAGASWGGGLTRVRGSTIQRYGTGVLPSALVWMRITDVQVDRSGSTRRILVGFLGDDSTPGSIGIYSGP